MFPGPNAYVYYNEAGEPLGWDYPAEPECCSECGGSHSSFSCPYDPYDNDGEPFEEDLEEEEDLAGTTIERRGAATESDQY